MEVTPNLTWESVAGFVRQHTHDVRNHLNSLDLEAALLAELATDEEARASVARLRKQIREAAGAMRALSAKFADPKPSLFSLSARDVFEIWKEQHTASPEAIAVDWRDELGEEKIAVDPDAVAGVFRELLSNAQSFGSVPPLHASATAANGRVTFTLRETKQTDLETSDWGRAPFRSTRRGAYGLGLWEVDRRVRANGGTLSRSFDPTARELTTSISFPVTVRASGGAS